MLVKHPFYPYDEISALRSSPRNHHEYVFVHFQTFDSSFGYESQNGSLDLQNLKFRLLSFFIHHFLELVLRLLASELQRRLKVPMVRSFV